ncbi:MAG: AraC family transcriptional regulator [Clostridia bacterium]|nr:AraC family transcriptional regulator [Clostridia bacterium]
MSDWTEGICGALAYMEEHLTDELNIADVARQAYMSPFHFQRMFSAMCGVSVGEYIRNRRMTLAAEDLLNTDEKIIDIAVKYGYDSPDSFARAFQRFHGILPSQARRSCASLRAYAPIRIQLTMKGGHMMEYRIAEKPAFTVMGIKRMFSDETSYQKIPEFWLEVMRSANKPVCGMYGVCIDLKENEGEFEYLIADNYIPWKEIPAGCEVRTIPASLWAVFPCRGPLPKALQDVNTRMWSEWLPACKSYRLAGNYNIEMYAPPAENPEDTYSEIWLPVEKI